MLIGKHLQRTVLDLSNPGRHFPCFIEIMFGKKCPSCGVKLGDYLYAGACPHCHEVLKCNLADPMPLHAKVPKLRSWPVRAFFRVRDFVES